MKTNQSVLIALFFGLLWTSCQRSAPDTSSFGNFKIVPNQSSITWNLTPTFTGFTTSLTTTITQGGLEIEKRKLLGGKATIDMMMPIFEAATDTATRNLLFKSVRSKSMFNTAGSTFGILQIKELVPQPKGNDITHIAYITLEVRNKRHKLEVPVHTLIRRGNAVITTAVPYKVSLSEWGMKAKKEKWMDNAEISLRIRATGAIQPGEKVDIDPNSKKKKKKKNNNKKKKNKQQQQ